MKLPEPKESDQRKAQEYERRDASDADGLQLRKS